MSGSGFRLVVEKGPAAGAEVAVGAAAVTVGRDLVSDVVLPGDEFVAARHATITIASGKARLRNHSPNGTLVNGRPVADTLLAPGDRIAIGRFHLLSLRDGASAAVGRTGTRPAAGDAAPTTATRPPARDAVTPPALSGFRMPTWLAAYLVIMSALFSAFVLIQARAAGVPGLAEIRVQEEHYATAHGRTANETLRVLGLLDTATVHERRGDRRSAYEAYREVLGVRQPIDPGSPAYRFAAARIAALGAK